MQRVSTNMTLVYKIFIPTFWIVFFGALMITSFVYKEQYQGSIPGQYLRTGTVVFFFTGILFMALTLFRLKRVEMAADFIYVTNYFKHYKYPWSNIEKIDEHKFFFMNIVTIHLKTKGHFGKRIPFIASNKLFRLFKADHPELEQLNP